MENANIVKLAIDLYHGNVAGNYSKAESSETLRQALIAANGGSTKIDYKSMRRNKVEIFEILEEVVPQLVAENLQNDEFFTNLVDYRNVAMGDQNDFIVDDDSEFIVSEVCDGNAIPRRQRIGEKTTVTVKTTIHEVRVYEELSRVLAGRTDWNTFIEKVANAVRKQLYADVCATFTGITSSTAGLNPTYVKAGSYSEEDILAIVEHVEAATGKTAMIFGTKAALRKCTTAVQAEQAKLDYYNAGYYGKLAGVPMVAIKQRHKVGTDTFMFPDNKLFILTSDEKPIKVVNEGDAIITDKDFSESNDLSMEYLYIEKYGVALVINGKLGVYTISTNG